ncbi:GMC family oxidoreductase N-terminal domain-containing protein [Mycobacterium tilburgii]|uniref:GMC family oxidoreductase N-terminal domain-containing protein n=1 Tax=Mycobacterium tilburgii TaxID=44467 RepID=UPI001642D90D
MSPTTPAIWGRPASDPDVGWAVIDLETSGFRPGQARTISECAPEVHPAAAAFFQACKECGHPVSDDLNGAQSEGVCWYDRDTVAGVRQSAADAYLCPALSRRNLTVRTGALVTGLTLTLRRCTGVTYPAFAD